MNTRYFFVLISIILSIIGVYGQSLGYSESHLKSYFDRELLTLDPIEGIYDVTASKQGENAFRLFPAETDNTTLYVYKGFDGKFHVYGWDTMSFTKLGDSNIYRFAKFWEGSNETSSDRFTLRNSNQFEIAFSVPIAQLRYDMGRNYIAGMGLHFKYSFYKTYPTQDMLERKYAEKQQKEIAKEWSGSGFALQNGYIVTNYHVVENAKSILVQGIKGSFASKYRAEVIASDKVNDLAILKICDSRFNGFGVIPYRIKTGISDVGEDVFVLGYPLVSTMGEEIKLTTGVISSKTGYQGDVSLYQISAPVQPGNSGGPLFDKSGNLIGIVSSKHIDTENGAPDKPCGEDARMLTQNCR